MVVFVDGYQHDRIGTITFRIRTGKNKGADSIGAGTGTCCFTDRLTAETDHHCDQSYK